MNVINWVISNWPALVSVLAMLLSVAVAIAHLAGATSVASKIQNIETIVQGLASQPAASVSPPVPPAPPAVNFHL